MQEAVPPPPLVDGLCLMHHDLVVMIPMCLRFLVHERVMVCETGCASGCNHVTTVPPYMTHSNLFFATHNTTVFRRNVTLASTF
jgi:hypothetical protein